MVALFIGAAPILYGKYCTIIVADIDIPARGTAFGSDASCDANTVEPGHSIAVFAIAGV
jgi:hypothetical protein